MEVKIERLDHFGRGICYVNHKICFVENALPNEIVDIEIVKEKTKFLEGKVLSIMEESPVRIPSECPYSDLCGGCHLNHLCFNEENIFKKEKVKDLITKFSSLSPDIIDNIVYHDRNYYRNKIVLHGKDGVLGLYKKNSNDIIPIQECFLVNHKIQEIMRLVHRLNVSCEEVIIKTSNDNSSVMISIKGEVSEIHELLPFCDVLIYNGKYLTDKKEILTNVGDKKYYEGVSSFFQVNNTLSKELYDEVISILKNKNYRRGLDLYCGTGTIGIYISSYCLEIIGVDYNVSNISDAIKNKELNGISNIQFICDKVENVIETFSDIDFVVVDPPRNGLDSKTRNVLKKLKCREIIYISCDPVTLARDLNDLSEVYEATKIKLFNMFPRTYHVECISVLERKNVEK